MYIKLASPRNLYTFFESPLFASSLDLTTMILECVFFYIGAVITFYRCYEFHLVALPAVVVVFVAADIVLGVVLAVLFIFFFILFALLFITLLFFLTFLDFFLRLLTLLLMFFVAFVFVVLFDVAVALANAAGLLVVGGGVSVDGTGIF